MSKITADEYQRLSLRTESHNSTLESFATFGSNHRLLHGAIGIATESGELLDAIKKHVWYGKPLDGANIEEEIGDVCWYLALLCSARGISLSTVMEMNIAKLRVRYPEKFTEEAALQRDLDAERKVLE